MAKLEAQSKDNNSTAGQQAPTVVVVRLDNKPHVGCESEMFEAEKEALKKDILSVLGLNISHDTANTRLHADRQTDRQTDRRVAG